MSFRPVDADEAARLESPRLLVLFRQTSAVVLAGTTSAWREDALALSGRRFRNHPCPPFVWNLGRAKRRGSFSLGRAGRGSWLSLRIQSINPARRGPPPGAARLAGFPAHPPLRFLDTNGKGRIRLRPRSAEAQAAGGRAGRPDPLQSLAFESNLEARASVWARKEPFLRSPVRGSRWRRPGRSFRPARGPG